MILMLIPLLASSFVTCLSPPQVSLMDPKVIKERRADFKNVNFDMVLVGSKKYVLPEIYKTQGSIYYNYLPKSDEIFLVNFPKAGKSWFREVVWLLVNQLDFHTANLIPVEKRVPWMEENLSMNKEGIQLPDESVSSQKIIQTNLPLSLIPNIFNYANKIIYIARNPKDNIVAFFKSVKTAKFNFVGDIERYWHHFGNDQLIYTPYWSHVQEGFSQRFKKTVLFLYSDEDPIVLISKISTFLGKTYSEQQLQKLCSYMSTQPQIEKETWKSLFSAELNNKINEWIHNNIHQMKFPNVNIYS